jgi:hypothetical protein
MISMMIIQTIFRNFNKHIKMIKHLLSYNLTVLRSYGLLFCLTALLLVGCIAEFVPPADMKDLAGLLVVDGVILEEGTRITLSRTVKLGEKSSAEFFIVEHVNNAQIHIIDENNTIIAVANQANNWAPYIVNESFSFVPGMKYALDIKTTDNKHYQSAFVTPLYAPEIDTVSYRVNSDNSIDIFVSTHDPANQTNCFMWDFDEEWEFRSKLFESHIYDPHTERFSIPQSLNGENRFYCWASDYSKSLTIATSEKYSDAVIRNHKIHSLQPGTTRYSYLYSIMVRQYGLDKETYLYFENLRKNLEAGGSLFAPQPSEIPGNIQCLSDPEETVIGYIFASNATTFRTYISMLQHSLSQYEDYTNCQSVQAPDDKTAFSMGLGFSNNQYIPSRCLDCTTRGGTKNKPNYWPNDHQ